MPELPEIETVKLQLKAALVGAKVANVDIRNPKTVHGDLKQIEGMKIIDFRRKGKVLLMDLEESRTAAFHFKMTGQLIFEKTQKIKNSKTQNDTNIDRIVGGHPTEDFVGKLPSKHTRVVLNLDQGTLYFNDQRMFGWVKIGLREEIEKESLLVKMGPEPFDITPDQFIELIKRSRRPIKIAIMDQEVISGVGNIYANDALWQSRINPRLPVNQLTVNQLISLFESIILVLNEGIKYGGATAANYVNLHGLGGKYQEHFRTYNQEGRPCQRCGTVIEKIVLGGRGTFYCPKCQK